MYFFFQKKDRFLELMNFTLFCEANRGAINFPVYTATLLSQNLKNLFFTEIDHKGFSFNFSSLEINFPKLIGMDYFLFL